MLSYKTIRPDTLELLRRLMAEPLFKGSDEKQRACSSRGI